VVLGRACSYNCPFAIIVKVIGLLKKNLFIRVSHRDGYDKLT